jgi:4-hydroxy 2-oxovalerate aldolase
MPKILDCTLRDGGYYNDWNFPLDVARQTITSLDQAGVDIVEIGLKSIPDEQCSGLFKYCNEDYLDFLNSYTNTCFSFMLNVKEFGSNCVFDDKSLDSIIRPADHSVFSMVRLATHFADIGMLEQFHSYFQDKGYRVGINLMGISLLDDSQISSAMVLVEKINPEVFYVADSFGSMLPDDVSNLVVQLRKHYSGSIGIHTHNNQGLAFANSLRAIDEGIEYIDSTLTGMGRGAGNLSTEQILLWLQNRGDQSHRYHSSRVLDVIHDYYGPLQEKFKWGFNYVYMLSGLKNTHPVYCMELCDGNKFSMSQITDILENIPTENRSVFNKSALNLSIRKVPEQLGQISSSSDLPVFSLPENRSNSRTCVLVSTGPGIEIYREALENLIVRREWQIIECNDTGVVDQFSNRLTVVLNRMRLREIASSGRDLAQHIVTGERVFEGEIESMLYHCPYKIEDAGFTETGVSIPEFEAGQYAISLAAALDYRDIYLAGFVGYQDESRNKTMEEYFSDLSNKVKSLNLISITPTRYRNLKYRSIYTL